MIIEFPFNTDTKTVSGIELYEYTKYNIDAMLKDIIDNCGKIVPPDLRNQMMNDSDLKNDIMRFYKCANIAEVNSYIDTKINYILKFLHYAGEVAVLADIDIGRCFGISQRSCYHISLELAGILLSKIEDDRSDIIQIIDNMNKLVQYKFRFITFPNGVKNEALVRLMSRLQYGDVIGIPVDKFTDSIILGPTDDPTEFDKISSAILSSL